MCTVLWRFLNLPLFPVELFLISKQKDSGTSKSMFQAMEMIATKGKIVTEIVTFGMERG